MNILFQNFKIGPNNFFSRSKKNFWRTNNTFNPPSFISLSAQVILPLTFIGKLNINKK